MIIGSYLEYESLNTLETTKFIGRILVRLTPEEQLRELQTVFKFLVDIRFLEITQKHKAHYWGQDFISCTYTPNEPFIDLVKQAQSAPSQGTNYHTTHLTVNQTNITLNIDLKLFDKLLGIKAGLVNL